MSRKMGGPFPPNMPVYVAPRPRAVIAPTSYGVPRARPAIPAIPFLPATQGYLVTPGELHDRQRLAQQIIGLDPQGATVPGEVPAEPAPTYRPLAGAKPNNRGGSVRIQINPATAAYQQPIAICESPRNNGQDAEAILVTLGLEVLGDADNTDLAEVTATASIEWGVGGAIYHAEIDWVNGVTFCLSASYVRINCQLSVVNPLSLTYTVGVSASLGYGSVGGRGMCPRKTVDVGSIERTGGVSSDFNIPLFATTFTITDTFSLTQSGLPTPDPDLQIELFKPDAGSFVNMAIYKYVDRSNCANQNELTFTIPNGARRFRIVNNDLLSSANGVRAIFNLGLP